MNWQLENHWNILLIGVLPLLIFLLFRFHQWRENKRNLFAERPFHARLFVPKSKLGKIFPVLYLSAFSFLILALLNFISQEKEEIKVNESFSNIYFLVDVSNSMNAEDTAPSRLERAKEILGNALQTLQNEKIGIIVFAGEARSIMPLTTDYSSAEIYLNGIHSGMILKQGTDFLAAIKEAEKKLHHAPKGTKKIILISDGEDHEGHHQTAIREAKNNGINITTIGIGTEQGSPIPELIFNYYADYKRDEYGQVVITKREISALKQIARETGGKYIDGNPNSAVRMLIHDIQTSQKEHRNKGSFTMLHTQYHYQWFLGFSVVLFLFIFLFNPKQDFDF